MPTDTGISDELTEKIFAFVDREAGRDAPLSPEDEALVRDLLETDPAARALADEFRATNTGLDAMFQAGCRDAGVRGAGDTHPCARRP